GRPGGNPPAQPLVIDLSSLWAGPLCANLLMAAGGRVVKVEDIRRPDGARGGAVQFFDVLNAGKASVALDFRSEPGRAVLTDLLRTADVIVTSARARAFEQLGLHPDEVLAQSRDKVWIAVTARGTSARARPCSIPSAGRYRPAPRPLVPTPTRCGPSSSRHERAGAPARLAGARGRGRPGGRGRPPARGRTAA